MKNEFTVKKLQDETVYTLESASSGGTSAGAVASVSSPMGGVRKRGDNLIAQEEKKEAPKPRNFVAKNAKMGGAGQHKDKKKADKQGDVKHKKPLAESYAEDLAKQVFNANPNIKDENAVLDAAWPIAVKDLGNKRAMSAFNYDEDFPSDLVSVYGWLQKDQQGMAEDHEVSMASNELKSIHSNARKLLDLVQRYGEQGDLEAWQQSKITKAADYLNSVLQSIGGEQNALGEVSLGDYRKKAGMQKAQSQMGAMFAKDPEEREKNLATFNKREKGLNRVKARDELARKSEQDKQTADLVARLPELKAEYERMKDEYKSLGGSNWQYADREQNLTDRERKARSMEGPMNNLWRQIQSAEKSQSVAEGDAYMESLVAKLAEKIPANAPVDVWIKDFEKSTAPQFRGKTQEKRKQMAIAASYGAKNPKKKK